MAHVEEWISPLDDISIGEEVVARVMNRVRRILDYSYPVPWCVPQWGWAEFAATVRYALGGGIVDGSKPQEFAAAACEQLGMEYAIPVNRGRTALELAFRGLGLGPNDEVVLPSYICPSVLEAARRAGVRTVFADVGPDLQVKPQTVEAAVTSRTRCVVVAHLFGNVAPIDEIERALAGRGIAIVDDAAQSLGARCRGRAVGTFGDCAIISCGPGKPLAGAAGGALITHRRELHERAAASPLPLERSISTLRRLLSFWAERRFRRFTLPLLVLRDRWRGHAIEQPHRPCRMSNADAAIGLAQLRRLDKNAAARRRNAQRMLEALGPLAECNITDTSEAGVAVKIVLVLPSTGPSVSEVIQALRLGGVESQRGYRPLHLDIPGLRGTLPITESLWDRVVCIPTQTPLRNRRRLARAVQAVL